MRILYCTNQLYIHGGIERILSQKMNALVQDFGHEVYLLTFEQKNQNFVYDLNSKIIFNDLRINYLSGKSYYHPKNIIKIVNHFFKLKSAISRIKPDIIISISFTPDQYFLPFISKKIPKIKELHSSGIIVSKFANQGKGFKVWFNNKLIDVFNKYNSLVLLNKDEMKYFPEANTFEINNFTDFVIEKNIEKENTIIAAGRIVPAKQFEELALIWKKIYLNFPDWKVKIFGDGNTNTIINLKRKVSELQIENSFLIFESTKNIKLEMQKAKVYAMTSQTECFPMVLLEAQICGLPIISYDCPNGPRNIINNEVDGFLIEDKNRILFSKKLSFLLTNKDLYLEMSQNTSLNFERFNKSKIMTIWNNLFQDVLKKAQSNR